MQSKNYPVEFVERTVELINKLSSEAKKENLDVTFLMNCMLGLIVATNENIKKYNYNEFNRKLSSCGEDATVSKNIVNIKYKIYCKQHNKMIDKTLFLILADDGEIAVDVKISDCQQTKDMTLRELLSKIRNGVSHQNIEPINADKEWKGVRIWNINRELKDFEVKFEVSELKCFSIFIAETYLKEARARQQ